MSRMNFSELTPEEVLMLAIDVEASNGTRLRTFAELFADYTPDVAKLFAEMADEEDEHKGQLEATYERRFGGVPQKVSEEDVPNVIEAFELDDGEQFVFNAMNLRRALQIVLAVEYQAESFYWDACSSTVDPEMRELYRQLAEFENGHMTWIERRLEGIGGSE
ncbi:MAG: ferritin family protein [Pirellulales bacterium]|nr:ferritin family protein [Pirellulales bacterium]HJN66116.1 ferritin family protein [Pirellulales bacterium]